MKHPFSTLSLLIALIFTACTAPKPNEAIFNNHLGKVPSPKPVQNNAFSVTKTNTETKPAAAKNKIKPPLIAIAKEGIITEVELGKKNTAIKKTVKVKEKESIKITPYKMPEIKKIVYIVKDGDHFTSIANAYGLAAEDLALENKLPIKAQLQVGQKLNLPLSARLLPVEKRKRNIQPRAKAVNYDSLTGQKYTVISGDYLYKIANNYGTTVKAITTVNKLNSNKLIIGQVLIIPNKNAPVTKKKNLFDETLKKTDPKVTNPDVADPDVTVPKENIVPEKVINTDGMVDVLIVGGDTLEGLANDFATTKQAIIDANNKVNSDEDLLPGLIIKVPSKK